MKKHFSLFFILCFSFSLFSYSGIYQGEKDIKVIKTKYFDIIYPSSCIDSASLLYENADDIFLEVTKDYGIKPSFNIPVVITSTVDTYNAFYTPAPFNRIVLYDTSSSFLDDLSLSFSETFLSTFRHELTHAVTYNMKNVFWKGFSSIFGDVMTPGFFFVSSGMAEGAAVSGESRSGEGRLNNEYSKHFVKQAKIEDVFPSFYEVQGSSNTTITGLYYYFNGAFHEHLQKKYGMEKYAELWSRVINLSRPTFSWCFDKTYGVSVRDEWKSFIEKYDLPENVIKDILNENVVTDFFNTKNNNKFSIENTSGSRFSSLFSNDKGIYYTEVYPLYKTSQKLFYIPYKELKIGENIKAKELFTKQLTENIIPSYDGRFIALSTMSNLDVNLTAKCEIYDTENKRFYKVKEDGLKGNSIVKGGEEYYLVSHKYESPISILEIKKIIIEDNKIKGVENIYSEKQKINTYISDFVDIENSSFCYIKKEGLEFSIVERCIDGSVRKEYKIGKGYIIKDLSYNSGKLFFSYVKENTMPRFGYFDLRNEKFFFSDADINGGVFNPVLIKDTEGKQSILYKGVFFNEDRLLSIKKDSVVLSSGEIKDYHKKDEKLSINNENSETLSIKENASKVLNIELEVEKENSNLILKNNGNFTDIKNLSTDYKWYKDSYTGVIVPLSIYNGKIIGEHLGEERVSTMLPWGVTYATSNPWSSGTNDLFLVTAGYSYLTNSLGLEAILNKGSSTSLYSYNIDLKTEFDRKGWKQSGGEVNVASSFSFGKVSSFTLQNSLSVIGGKSNNIDIEYTPYDILTLWNKDLFETSRPLDDKNIDLNITELIRTSYSSVHKQGSGLFEKRGLKLSLTGGYIYDTKKGDQAVLSMDGSFYVPHLIPISQKRGLTYNLPLVFNFSLLPINSDYGLTNTTFEKAGRGVIDANLHTVLFAWDVQRVIPYVEALYFQKVYLTFGYDATIASYKGTKNGFQPLYFIEYLSNLGNKKSIYLDSIYMQLSLEITPNIGVLATNNSKMKMYGRISYPFNVVPEEEKKVKFSFGFNTQF